MRDDGDANADLDSFHLDPVDHDPAAAPRVWPCRLSAQRVAPRSTPPTA